MALTKNADGAQLILQIGNGGGPETFTATCTINTTRSLKLSATASTTELADCVTPTNPAQIARIIKSVDLTFDGAGIADTPSILALIQWQQSGAQKNVKIIQNLTGANGGWTATGPMVCLSMDVSGARGDSQTFTGSFAQAAQFTFTANP